MRAICHDWIPSQFAAILIPSMNNLVGWKMVRRFPIIPSKSHRDVEDDITPGIT